MFCFICYQESSEWCQKIDADEIAHFLDVDIAMKESEMKYSTALVSYFPK